MSESKETTVKELLAALEEYDRQRAPSLSDCHCLQLFSDGSGVVQRYGEDLFRFDSIAEVMSIFEKTNSIDPAMCPNCGRLKGKARSGADFAGQMCCRACGHVWPYRASNGYGHLP